MKQENHLLHSLCLFSLYSNTLSALDSTERAKEQIGRPESRQNSPEKKRKERWTFSGDHCTVQQVIRGH
jgi:hypothetical protein